jgi:hypothetical protein
LLILKVEILKFKMERKEKKIYLSEGHLKDNIIQKTDANDNLYTA